MLHSKLVSVLIGRKYTIQPWLVIYLEMVSRYKHPSTSNQKNVEIRRSRKCAVIEILKSNELEVVESPFYRVLVVISKFILFKNYCVHIRYYYYFDINNNKMKTFFRVYIM